MLAGIEEYSEVRAIRRWKLPFLLPRMLLCQPPRGGIVLRKKLEARFKSFQDGHWIALLNEGTGCAERLTKSVRRGRRQRF